VQALVANRFSIADPDDTGMLGVIGIDVAVPAPIRDFAVNQVGDRPARSSTTRACPACSGVEVLRETTS
jgi:hypothetical protein